MYKKKNVTRTRSRKKTSGKRTLSQGTTAIIVAFVVAVCLAIVLFSPTIKTQTKNIATTKTPEVKQTQSIDKTKSNEPKQTKQSSSLSKTQSTNEVKQSSSLSNKPSSSAQPKQSSTVEKPKQSSSASSNARTQPKQSSTTAQTKVASTKSKTTNAPLVAKANIPKPSVPAPSAKKLPDIPNALNKAELVFVFDDAGQNLAALDKYLSLPFPISVAVLPSLPASRSSADAIRASKNEVLLHQPMQALNTKINPGPSAITPNMTTSEIASLVIKNIENIGGAAGINNHEGSMISEDEIKIGTVMQVANERGMFFLDSRTTSQTRVPQASMELGIPYYERNIFLDNVKDRDKIIAELLRGLQIANQTGSAIMIGHIWSSDILPALLTELYPTLHNKGYTFSTVSKSRAKKLP